MVAAGVGISFMDKLMTTKKWVILIAVVIMFDSLLFTEMGRRMENIYWHKYLICEGVAEYGDITGNWRLIKPFPDGPTLEELASPNLEELVAQEEEKAALAKFRRRVSRTSSK